MIASIQRNAMKAIGYPAEKDEAVQALYILARFPGAEAQQRLAGILFDPAKRTLHAIAARELTRHIQKNGLVLTDDQINLLRAMEQAKDVPPEIRVELAVLVGTLRATAQQTGTRLLGYVPERTPRLPLDDVPWPAQKRRRLLSNMGSALCRPPEPRLRPTI